MVAEKGLAVRLPSRPRPRHPFQARHGRRRHPGAKDWRDRPNGQVTARRGPTTRSHAGAFPSRNKPADASHQASISLRFATTDGQSAPARPLNAVAAPLVGTSSRSAWDLETNYLGPAEPRPELRGRCHSPWTPARSPRSKQTRHHSGESPRPRVVTAGAQALPIPFYRYCSQEISK